MQMMYLIMLILQHIKTAEVKESIDQCLVMHITQEQSSYVSSTESSQHVVPSTNINLMKRFKLITKPVYSRKVRIQLKNVN